MSKVDEAIAEIDAALADMAPSHEGLRDFAVLDIQPETKNIVHEAIDQYDRRRERLETAREELAALVSDGYPTLEIEEVQEAVLADLRENAKTIEAALAKFKQAEATTVVVTPGTPENQ